jgi:putative Mn2+ efflux pump MntP
MSVATLVRREAALDRKEMAMRASARIAKMQDELKEKVGKAKSALANVQESSAAAIATNGAARVGGMALEAYARKKMTAEKAKAIGPIATVAAIVGYTMGMTETKASTQYALFTAAGIAEGAASRFLIEQIDRAIA